MGFGHGTRLCGVRYLVQLQLAEILFILNIKKEKKSKSRRKKREGNKKTERDEEEKRRMVELGDLGFMSIFIFGLFFYIH